MRLYFSNPETLANHSERIKEAKASNQLKEYLSDFVNQRADMTIENSIAYIHIYGPLLRDATQLDKALGSTDYCDIEEDIETALEAGVKAIIFVCDSGGGQVSGVAECADLIQDLPVPSVAYVNGGLACSAAYYLIAGCTYIVASKSAQVGNIGAIMAFADTSVMYQNLGVSMNIFTNEGADLKSIGYDFSLTEDQKTFLQESISEIGTAFKDHVLSNRPDINDVVWRAGWYRNEQALALGLIDEVGGEDVAVNRAMELANIFTSVEEPEFT